jgi:hypothetical protein
LRPDGRIDAVLADEQLRTTVDLSRGKTLSRVPRAARATPETSQAQRAQVQLLAARALNASVAAERARRALDSERGRYALARDVDRVCKHALAGFLDGVEATLPDIAADLDLSPSQLRVLRTWWSVRRERAVENVQSMGKWPGSRP